MSLFAVAVGAAVHAALVPTHWGDERTVATLFIADVLGFVLVGIWMLARWRFARPAVGLMLAGTAAVYLLYILRGWEAADAVGIMTTAIELAGVLVLVVPARGLVRPGQQRLTVALSLPVAVVALVSASVLATPAAATVPAGRSTVAAPSANDGMAGMAKPVDSPKLSLATDSPAGAISWPDSMGAMAPGMAMVTPDCSAPPTRAEQNAAVSLVDRTTAAVAPYKILAAARASGYVPVTPSGRRVVHYINYSVAAHASPLDPDAIPVLVYVNTRHGAVLSAAMYLARVADAGRPPQPGGCLTQWHLHRDLCFSGSSVVGNDEHGGCTAGSDNKSTMPMMHVWVAPVSGGPLAPDPPAVSEVVAAAQLPLLPTPNAQA